MHNIKNRLDLFLIILIKFYNNYIVHNNDGLHQIKWVYGSTCSHFKYL